MRLRNSLLPFLVFLCLLTWSAASAQDSSLYSKIYSLPDKLFRSANARSIKAEQQLTRQTEKYIARLAKQERKLKRKLSKKDSAAAKEIFGDVNARYAALQQSPGQQQVYSAHLDSMQTAVNFLQQYQSPAAQEKFTEALNNYNQLQASLNYAEAVKKYLTQRQQFLRQQLQQTPLAKEFRKFQEQVYYYRAQVHEYKTMWENPSLLESKLLQLATKIPAFKDFFARYSQIGRLFPPNTNGATYVPSLAGLQTRDAVQFALQQRLGTDPDIMQSVQQNVSSASSQLRQLKDRAMQSAQGAIDDPDIPGFRPNQWKTKSFLQRIEMGFNIQSARSSSFFPATSDLGLSIGYRINNRSTMGVGGSYKMGWGKDIRNIRISHEGVSLRSFLDWKVKGSFYASAGFEYNYQQPFTEVQQLRSYDQWQQSGLVGITKIVSINSKVLKKTKVQLLWDVLSYRQQPAAQPLKFRIGYNLH